MRRALTIRVGVIPLTLVLLQMTGQADAAPLPVGTIQTPIIPSGRSWWGHAGPLVSGAAGTLFGDGTVRSSLSPTRRVPVAAPLGALLAQAHGSTAVANDSDAGLIAGAGPITGTGMLWRVGLATGRVESRRLTLGSPYRRLLGLTPTAWVLLLPDGAARLVPFGRSSTTLFKPPQLVRVLSAGSRGIVYLARSSPLAGSPYTWEVRLVTPNLSVTSVLSSGTSSDGAAPLVDAVMSQGAVSWLSQIGRAHV